MFDREIKWSASASAEQMLVFQVPLVGYYAFNAGGCQDGDPAVTEASEIELFQHLQSDVDPRQAPQHQLFGK